MDVTEKEEDSTADSSTREKTMSVPNIVPDDLQVDDARKVFVSRVPRSYDGDRLQLEMENILGAGTVESSTILWDTEEDCSRGSAFVVFTTKEHRSVAVKRGSFKVSVVNGKAVAETVVCVFCGSKALVPMANSAVFPTREKAAVLM
jgi:hypothetical protein